MSALDRRPAVVEANFAAVAGQLQPHREPGRLRLDAHDIVGTTARLVGAALGETEIDTAIALTQLYVEQGAPETNLVLGTKKSLARLVYGKDNGGGYSALIHNALVALWRMELHFRGYDAARGESRAIYGRLLTRLVFDEQINFLRDEPERYDASIMGRRWQGTVQVTLDDWFGLQLREGYWVELDWEKLRTLGGIAKTLWLLLSSPTVPFRACPADPGHEEIGLPLDAEAYQAFGINRARERDSRRALVDAGKRIMRTDPIYTRFDVVDDVSTPGAKRLLVTRRSSSIELGPAAAHAQMALSL